MAYVIKTTHRFEKSLDRCVRRGLPMDEFTKVVRILEKEGKLPRRYKPHKLTGNRCGQWECHIRPDWLLVWTQNDRELIILLLITGSHADMF